MDPGRQMERRTRIIERMDNLEGTFDVLISADAEEKCVVFIDVHSLIWTGDSLVEPGALVHSMTREANQSEWLLAQKDHWFLLGRLASISDLLDIPAELRRFAQVAYEWANTPH